MEDSNYIEDEIFSISRYGVQSLNERLLHVNYENLKIFHPCMKEKEANFKVV